MFNELVKSSVVHSQLGSFFVPNNHRENNMKWKIIITTLCLSILTGCTDVSIQQLESQADPIIEEILDQAQTSSPAIIYGAGNVFEKAISLVFEGMTDPETMKGIADILEEENIESIMFIPAVEMEENTELMEYLIKKGIQFGNYGLTGEEGLGESASEKIARQVYLSNIYVEEYLNTEPSYFYATRSTYPEHVLRIVSAVGLDGVVEPNKFLNYKSFTTMQMAYNYVSRNLRGDVVSIKLSGELNQEEANINTTLDETPASDKQGTIIDEKEDSKEEEIETVDILQMLRWFLQGCESNGIEIIPLKQLKEQSVQPREAMDVDEELLAKLDISLYPQLTTDFAFGLQEGAKVDHTHFIDSVFVGDSIMEYIESYVNEKRQIDSTYLGNAQFLAMGGLSARNALWEISDESRHPIYNGRRVTIQDGIAAMGNIKKVYIMLGLNDTHLTDSDTHLENYQTLLELISHQSPQVEFYIMSITPGTDIDELNPNNQEIFERNLKLIEWCAMYGYNYIDVATVLRNINGALPTALCVDTEGQGYHYTEEAIEIFWEYLYTHTK